MRGRSHTIMPHMWQAQVPSRYNHSMLHFKATIGENENGTHTGITPTDEQEVIAYLCEKGQVTDALNALFCMETAPSDAIYLSLLKACNKNKAFPQVNCVYEHLVQHNVVLSFSLGDYLVMMLAKCGSLKNAFKILRRLPRRSVFSWTAIISSYVDSGQGQEALAMYKCMLEDGVCPDNYTFVSLFKACSNIFDLRKGKKLHLEAERHGVASDLFVCNTLISMYGKCRDINEAEDVFRNMQEHNVVSWSVMISAYVEQGQAEKALKLYRQMLEEDINPDQRTFLFTLQACALLAKREEGSIMDRRLIKAMSLEIGQALHADVRVKGFSSNSFISSALLSMYGKCNALVEAEDVISVLHERNIITWNALLSVYIEHDMGEKALRSYKQMLKECMTVDDVTFLSLLQACGEIGFIEICQHIHFDIVSAGYDEILPVGATLIHAYGNSASMKDAQSVFDGILKPHIPSWNACISGYAGEGSPASIDMFEEMKLSDFEPDEVTFILILSACSHCGLIGQGIEYFLLMYRDYGLNPDLRHYGIMANLLGRAGNFRNIESMLGKMHMQANSNIWLCLLGACRTHGNIELAKQAFDQVVRLQAKHAIPYVLMSNIYANAGMENCALEVEKCREKICGKEDCPDLDEN